MGEARSYVCRSRSLAWTVLLGIGCLVGAAEGVVVHGPAMDRPAGGFIGKWNGSTGVAIGSHAFVTARHVGGKTGNSFVMRGVSYTATAIYQHPSADIAVVEVEQELAGWHQLAESYASGDRVVLGGMGNTAGEFDGDGYPWTGAKMETWGENNLSLVLSSYVSIRFDESVLPSEATFALYDSGGGVFVENESGGLALAGVAVSVSGGGGFSSFGDRAYSVNLQTHADFLEPYLTPEVVPCPADMNGDGAIDAYDYTLLIQAFSRGSGGDLDDDGDTDLSDLVKFFSAYGTECG